MFATKKKGLETRSTIEDRKVKRWSVHVGASIFRKGVESSLGSSRFGCGAVAARVKTVPRRFHRAVLNLLSIPVVNNIRPVVTTASERVHTGDAEASQRTHGRVLVPGTACSNNGVEFSAPLVEPAARISEKSRQRGNAPVFDSERVTWNERVPFPRNNASKMRVSIDNHYR